MLIGGRPAGEGSGREKDPQVRPLFSQSAYQFDCRQYFSDRNSVKPCSSGARRSKWSGNEAQAFPQSSKIPAVEQSPVK